MDSSDSDDAYAFRERIEWSNFSIAVFKENFRCTPATAELLLQHIGAEIQPQFYKNHALSAQQRLLIALKFFGDNDDYHSIAFAHHVSKATVFNAIHSVAAAVINRLSFLIAWPDSDEHKIKIAQDFFNLSRPGIPGICGAIDGSLIPIQAPSIDEPQYVDRHARHSINAMAVAGPDLYFYSFSCRWPGSAHDARVLKNSALYTKFQLTVPQFRPFANAVILGDSAYPRMDWLVPMQKQVQPQYAALFNAHPKARRVVECAWGLLKERFQCTHRTLKLKNPANAAKIIKCCAILHNFLIIARDNWEVGANEDAGADEAAGAEEAAVADEAAGADEVAIGDEVAVQIHNNAGQNRIALLNHAFLHTNNLL